VHVKESEPIGLSKLLTGQTAVLGFPWTVLDSLFIALPLSVTAMIVGIWIDHRREPVAAED
jgi:SSS family solute:Na+ symporter